MIKKLLLRVLGNGIYQPGPIETKKMQDWLFQSYKDSGFKNYYTMRKKYLVNMLLMDLSEHNRAKIQGRLEELQGLSTNINTEVKNRKSSDTSPK